MSGPTQRTSIQLYRDLLRLLAHIAPGASPKSIALRTTVRAEFEKSRNEEDPATIEALKANAVRALSNYMLYQGGVQDKKKGGKLGAAMDNFHRRSVQGMQSSKSDANEKEASSR